MIAITFALPSESQPLRQRFRHTGDAMLPHTVLGNLGLHECLLIHTGIGAEQTEERLRAALAQHSPSLLISSGFAGALVRELSAGQLFLAENVSDAELFKRASEFFQTHEFPLSTGRLVSSANWLELPEEKQALGRSTGAQAVDMETETIAALCLERQLPLLSLRVISDNAVDPIPVPFSVCIDVKTGRPRPGAIARHLAQHPWRIPGFLQFAKRATTGSDLMSRAIAAVIPTLQPL